MVYKVNASAGSVVGTYAAGSTPYGAAFDGAHIWVANFAGSTITKLGLNGGVLGTFGAGSGPEDVAFDGTYMWVVNANDSTVSKL
jgi:DNA-binding beta-propeller fold protein YncE